MAQVYQATPPKAPLSSTVKPADVVPSFMPALQVATKKDTVPRYKPLDQLGKYRFWQPNAHKTTWALIIDIDSDSWLVPFSEFIQDHPQLVPSWIIEKAENGHGQIAWIIEHVSHGPNSRQAPQHYARDVRQALTNAFDADQHFTNARCWNPFWTGWAHEQAGQVFWGHSHPRSLGDLRTALVDAGKWDTTRPLPYTPAKRGTRTVETLHGAEGRNEWIFENTRLRAHGTVQQVARNLNDQLADPLDSTELNTIIKSITEYEETRGKRNMTSEEREEHTQRQAERGALGGSKNTDKQQAARSKGPSAAAVVRSTEALGRAAQIREYHRHGYTQKQIMAKLKISRSTVSRALKK